MEKAKIALTKKTLPLVKIIKRVVDTITMFIIKDAAMTIKSMYIMQAVVMTTNSMSAIIIKTVVGMIMGKTIMTILIVVVTNTVMKNLENES